MFTKFWIVQIFWNDWSLGEERGEKQKLNLGRNQIFGDIVVLKEFVDGKFPPSINNTCQWYDVW